MVESGLTEDKHLKFGVSSHAKETTSFFDTTPISIRIANYVIKDGITKHVEYQVVVKDKDGDGEVFRRFSEFDLLREALAKKWPGCVIPPIPSKQVMGNLEPKVIEERKKILNDFLVNVSKLKYLYYSEEFKLFIRGGKDYEKALGTLPKSTYIKLVEDFQLAFPELSGREINASLILKITAFESYLKRIKFSFDNFEKMASNLAKERQMFTEKFTLFHNYLMPEYEKNCFKEYCAGADDGLLFANPSDTKLPSIIGFLKDAQGENYYENLADMLRYEDRDIGAFMEALSIRKSYEGLRDKSVAKEKEIQIEIQKTLAGKTTMKTLFSKGSKDDTVTTLEKNMALAKKETEELQFICDIITVLIGYVEIDKFKAEKQKTYYTMLASLSASETQYQKLMSDFWTHVSENHNLK